MLQDLEATRATVAEPASPLPLVNLLHDLDALVPLFQAEIGRESWLNAFLLAAGANQIAEDHLHDDPVALPRVARHVRRVLPWPAGAGAAAAVRAGAASRRWWRDMPWSERAVVLWQQQLASLVDGLASCIVDPPDGATRADLRIAASIVGEATATLPTALRRSVVRLPSCFRNFDQHPDDLERLTREFSSRWHDRSTAVAVLGVRTSGSYTAPLHGAWLRALGYRDVQVLTFRPERPWRSWEREALDHVRRERGAVLVTDDPPKSGGSLLRATRELEKAGFAAGSIVPVLQTLPGSDLPDGLRRYPHVVLEAGAWAVQGRLEPSAVKEALEAFLPMTTVVSVQRCALPAKGNGRRHVEARYSVRLQAHATREATVEDVYVKGVGLGYFGEHTLAVSRAVSEFVPKVFGVRDGLLYRRWLAAGDGLGEIRDQDRERVAAGIAAYVAARASRLEVEEDLSMRMVDRGAVWQRAADMLAKSFGRWDQFARPLSHPVARALLRVDRASVVDGSMGLDRWFRGAAGGALEKVDYDERAFSSLDLYCFDAAFDLAGVEGGVGVVAADAYARLTRREVDPERWLLYRLVHLAESERDAGHWSTALERALAKELQEYFGRTLFAGLEPVVGGPLCVFDLDWTLETRRLGFPAITPAGALALRSLGRHGYSVLLCTGRSVDEVRERCAAYRLAGGVAEYGAAVYDHRTGESRSLLDGDQRRHLGRLREVLAGMSGVTVDPGYEHAVRAYAASAGGRRRGLEPAIAAQAIEAAGVIGRVRVIAGGLQTDFMARGVDKGTGVVALGGAPARIELAAGDSPEDVPFLRRARTAVTPRGSELAGMRGRPVRVGARGPRAVEEGVTRLLGHRPGDCELCRTDAMSPRTRLLLAILSAQDDQGVARVWRAVRTAARARRLAH